MKYTLLISICTLLIFSCKKDDDKIPDQTQGGNGGKDPISLSCKYSDYKAVNSAGEITFGYKYHYSNGRLDSATPLANLNLYTYIYSYPEEGKRRVDYSYNGQLFGSYNIETFNEYGEILTDDSYDENNNPINSSINEYICDFTSSVSNNKYCLLKRNSYYVGATNTTTVTDYYYTGSRLDSNVNDKGYKTIFEYIDDNTRKAQNYSQGVKTDRYAIQKLNEYGKAIEIKGYKETGEYTGITIYNYKCD